MKSTGNKFIFADGFVQRGDQVFFGDGTGFEELFHQLVFALGDEFDKFFMSFFGLVGHVGRDGAFLTLTVAAHFVGVGFHADEIDDAAKTFLAADGKLEWGDGASESVDQRFEDAVGVGAVAVHTVDDDHARAGRLRRSNSKHAG